MLLRESLIHYCIPIKFRHHQFLANSGNFFIKDHNNSIKFWNCPSYCKWTLHDIVDKEIKKLDLASNFLYKSLRDFSRKNKYNEVLNSWRITFQALDSKGQCFLEFLNENLKLIELLYFKGGLQLNFFKHSNLICVRALRAIVNYAFIGEY